jgi:hypothetical protein
MYEGEVKPKCEICLVCVVCQMRGGAYLFIGGRWWRHFKEYSPLFNMLSNSFQMMCSLSITGWADFCGLWRECVYQSWA